jgi:hypothetical protein
VKELKKGMSNALGGSLQNPIGKFVGLYHYLWTENTTLMLHIRLVILLMMPPRTSLVVKRRNVDILIFSCQTELEAYTAVYLMDAIRFLMDDNSACTTRVGCIDA